MRLSTFHFGQLLICLVFFSNCDKNTTIHEPIPQENWCQKLSSLHPRSSVVFILGEDKEKDNPYYNLAKRYYLKHQAINQRIVTSSKSLEGVINYLSNNPPLDGQAWGKVEIIVHSNEWFGLAVPILKSESRTNTHSLLTAIQEDKLKPVPNHIIDEKSKVIFNACGLGRNKEFLNLLSYVFYGPVNVALGARVNSSENFIQYGEIGNEMVKFESDYYYAFFKTGYRPSNSELAKQYRLRYPNVELNWEKALSSKQPNYAFNPYHYYFNIPVNWLITYGEANERPKFSSQKVTEQWIREQKELMAIVAKTLIPFEKFRWRVNRRKYTFPDGISEPAMEIKGKTSVLCVLNPRIKMDYAKSLLSH